MTSDELKAIRERCEKATPPADPKDIAEGWYQIGVRVFKNNEETGWFPMNEENTAFYLAARSALSRSSK